VSGYPLGRRVLHSGAPQIVDVHMAETVERFLGEDSYTQL
jgi:hypothetical protein